MPQKEIAWLHRKHMENWGVQALLEDEMTGHPSKYSQEFKEYISCASSIRKNGVNAVSKVKNVWLCRNLMGHYGVERLPKDYM